MRGNTDASTTRSRSVPWTRKAASRTPCRSREPIAQLREAWWRTKKSPHEVLRQDSSGRCRSAAIGSCNSDRQTQTPDRSGRRRAAAATLRSRRRGSGIAESAAGGYAGTGRAAATGTVRPPIASP
jgi:hypothetical protein